MSKIISTYSSFVGPLAVYLLYGLGSILGFRGAIRQAGFILIIFFGGFLFGGLVLLFGSLVAYYIFRERYERWVNKFNKKFHTSNTKEIIFVILRSFVPEAVLVFFLAFFIKGVSDLFNEDFYSFGDIFFLPIAYFFSLLWIRIMSKNYKVMVMLALFGFIIFPLTAPFFVPVLKYLVSFLFDISNLNFTPTPIVFMVVSFLAAPFFVEFFRNIIPTSKKV